MHEMKLSAALREPSNKESHVRSQLSLSLLRHSGLKATAAESYGGQVAQGAEALGESKKIK